MRKRAFKNMIVSVICASILFIGVGYAYVTESMKDTGVASSSASLNVIFTGISGQVLDGSMATNDNAYVSDDKKSVSFDATLIQRGDKVLYTVEVYNEGNTDAVIRNIKVKEKKVLDESREEILSSIPVSYVVEGLSEGAVIPSGSKSVFTILVEYENREQIEGAIQKNVTVSLNYKVAQK